MRCRTRLHATCLIGILSLCGWAAFLSGPPLQGTAQAQTTPEKQKLSFDRDIRPLLAEKCFACHGPAASRDDGEIRLDIRSELLLPDEQGRAVLVPGKPEYSELIRRIESMDDGEMMPPPSSKKTLSDQEKATLSRWVSEGAEYEAHWAFQSPKRPPLPAVRNSKWARNAIDDFVLAVQEAQGLQPSPPTDKATWLRRLSLDLTGLPPTVEELDAYLADTAGDADERQIDRLLQSPHYGERWGRLWLDAARYADSDGYEKDKPRFVSRYRDWVINAFNRDQPYDEFIIDQIAGDMRPDATQDQWVATGFLRNSMINEEGGVDPEQFRMEAMFDRMDAIGKSVLGLTIQCAQCHSHKYDPVTQDDYYRMFAFLNNSYEGSIATYTPEQLRQCAELQHRVRTLETEFQHQHPEWVDAMGVWEAQVRERDALWTVVQSVEDDLSGGQKMYRMPDGSYLCQGYAPTKHTVTIQVTAKVPAITAIRLEQLNDPNLPLGGPGRSIQGTSALTEFKVRAWPVRHPEQATAVKFAQAAASTNAPEKPLDKIYADKTDRKRVIGPIAFAIDGINETAWGIDVDPVRRNRPCQAVFVPETPLRNPEGTVLEVQLVQNHGGWNSDDNQNHNLGRFRLAVTGADEAAKDLVPSDVRLAITVPYEQRTPEQAAIVFAAWRENSPEGRELTNQINALWVKHPEPVSQLVLQERDAPRMTSLLDRGDFLKPVHAVSAGTPKFLHPMKTQLKQPDRLDFARWLVDRDSPTAARSIVNRIWQAWFGEGLVSTVDDLGTQGTRPTHPELLDWLSVELMESGWSLKHLQRLIAGSATYRQSSRVTESLLQRDPANHWLTRGPRFRVDAEVVRDIALAASGLLNPTIGGSSVYPPAPEFLFVPPASYGPKVWQESQGADRYRRAIYTFRFRSVPYPMLQAFDAPNADVSCVRRSRSNTPLQALTTLNEPLFMEASRALARQMIAADEMDDTQRLAYGFRRCVARVPTDTESLVLLKLLQDQQARFSQGGMEPLELATEDPEHPGELPPGVSASDLAAWTAVARVMLNLDETITKE
ncbi:MAG: PSD1 domain-containing protein [Planctomycetaceae bacterium]|nr:PSD1 domain-containing protein [Planctomycetaceae bacterium]